jgi:uncharacterized coiled-coil DUF342 family protein
VIRVLAIAMCLTCAGCAARKAVPTAPVGEPDYQITQIERDIRQIEAELEQTLQVAARPDCPRVCELGGNICKLAQKICDIASRNPQHQNLKDRCKDARRSCEAAHQKVSEHCECSARGN